MKKHFGTILIVLILMTGLSLFLYPTVSNLRSESYNSQAVKQYADRVEQLQSGGKTEALAQAAAYNRELYRNSINTEPSKVSASDYEYMLNISGDGMMGYVEIPKIKCRLPVYHGTDAATLESYVGHLPSSSLPVGGESTHCVLTGHTGMPNAKLLNDLDKLETGDTFTVTALNTALTYEVDQVLVLQPDETDALAIEPGKDLCTLVTCTPYGINTHRLLVRGHRVAQSAADTSISQPDLVERLYSDPIIIALAALLILLMITYAVTRRNQDE